MLSAACVFMCVYACVCEHRYPKRHSCTCLNCQSASPRDGSWWVSESVRVLPFKLFLYVWHDPYYQKHTHTQTQICVYSFFFLTDSVFLLLVDEREDVQKKTFTKWVNSQLAKVRQLPACFLLSTLFTAVYPLFNVYTARLSNWTLNSLGGGIEKPAISR